MNCLEYRSLVSSHIDHDMSPAEVVEVERHLAACPRCASIEADVRTLVAEASQLPAFEPDPRVWKRLQASCEAEGLTQYYGKPSGWLAWLPSPDLRLATAAATLVVLMTVASLWLYRGMRFTPTNVQSSQAQETQVSNEVRIAEQNYLQAIEDLEKISQARMAQMDPSVKGVLEDNLATIDYYIDKCRETVKNEPANALAQRYLLEAYRKKVDLLASIVHSDVL